MGQFKKLTNMTKMQILSLRGGTQTMVDKAGGQSSISAYYNNTSYVQINVHNTMPFSNFTGWGDGNPIFYASSNDNIPYSQERLVDVVGTTATSIANTSNGWTASITITSQSEVTIKSLLATKRLFYGTGSSYNSEFLIYAYILDNPITLNAENNYTANLVFAVAFE